MRRLQRLARSNRGAALIAVAVMLAALAAVAIIAVDLSRLLVARAELQNAADAGALAGARLFMDEPIPGDAEIHSHAEEVAGMNEAFAKEGSELIPIENIDTAVNSDPSVQSVTVTTRSVVSQYFTGLVALIQDAQGADVQQMNARESLVMAKATARVGEYCDAKCLKPWSIPDRWDNDRILHDPEIAKTPGYDQEEFTDRNDNHMYDPGEPFTDQNDNDLHDGEFYHPLITGYKASTDHGLKITLKANNDTKPVPGQYQAIDLPNEDNISIPGADWYRWNIGNCNPSTMGPGSWVWTENGNMVGPTKQGMEDLINQDPNAHWDDDCQCIEGSDPQFELSPRIGLIPIHDPRIPYTEGKQQLQLTKIAAFFIEEQLGNGEVVGRFLKIQQVGGTFCPPGETAGGFLWNLSLVE